MGDVARDLGVSYFTVLDHRDRLVAQGKLREIKRVRTNLAVFEVTCPEDATAERGADLVLQQEPPKIIRWS